MSIKANDYQMGFGDISAQRILEKYKNHPLMRIRREFSFELFRDRLEALYSNNGRPGFDPVKMLALLMLGKLQNMSDNRLEFDVCGHVIYRAFCGFTIDEDTPDHSTISRFRDRIQPAWDEIWASFCDWLEEHGGIKDSLAIVDSTAIQARTRFRKEKSDKDENGKTDYSGQTDPDARHGHKSAKKPFYGYKEHVAIDGDSDFIVAVETTGGEKFDGDMLPPLISKIPYLPAVVTGDKAYNSAKNRLFLWSQGVQDKTIPKVRSVGRPPKTHKQRKRIERVFSVIKEKFGFKRTRFIGLAKVAFEACLSAFAFNLVNLLTIRGSPV